MSDAGGIDVYLGLDVGKGEHHGTALTPAGRKVFDKPLPNREPRLRELFEKLQSGTERCWSWWTSRPRSGLCRWPSRGMPAVVSPICRD